MENVTKRRDRHDIVAEILKTARGGKIKTHIMYKAKLSCAQIYEYIDLLAKKGFLENTETKRKRKISTMYRTTQKGMALLHHIESANKLLE